MEGSSREIVYPTIDQICNINRRMIDSFGGSFSNPDNLHNLGALEYILVAVISRIYGQDLFPTLKEKAAAIAYQIISRHVFYDGNKRTAIHIAWEFLHSNGVHVVLEESIVDLAEAIAGDTATYEQLFQWLHGHQQN